MTFWINVSIWNISNLTVAKILQWLNPAKRVSHEHLTLTYKVVPARHMDRNKFCVSHATSDNWEVYSVNSYFILRITLKLLSIKEFLSFHLTLQADSTLSILWKCTPHIAHKPALFTSIKWQSCIWNYLLSFYIRIPAAYYLEK